MSQPLARDVAVEIAKLNGVCIRPLALRRLDLRTGTSEIIDVPCGSTMEAKCPPCATRNQHLRMAQCRKGWHLDTEPVVTPDPATEDQRWLIEFRADLQARHDSAEDPSDLAEAIDAVDAEINTAGLRGSVTGPTTPKRSRSTRRRQDAPDLPKRKMAPTTLGRTFTGADGATYRPSLFVTLTLPSYGKVRNGIPVDPAAYDYRRAARDALHFSKLVDRFVQNLRRVAGFDVQYFATVEPQKRLAPHLHMAIRGTLPRAEMKQIAAATYHQVWWPSTDEPLEQIPVWDDEAGYLDPATGEVLPTWDEALDQLDEPQHVIRFGDQVDVKGILSGTQDADQCIRYLSKYLTKSLGEGFEGRQEHADRFLDALRYEPCSPTCPNWLRYGVQPKHAKRGMLPGHCRSKAHKPDHLGYAGRRVLVSRKWSNKTLTEHKQDRRTWVLEALGQPDEPTDPHRYLWRPVKAGDPDLAPLGVRLLRSIADRQRWRAHLRDLSATEEEAA
ncbi:helitron helicase-like domain-containing protein [Nonomuraea sp. NBC_01738]|uniref:replication initiator n=1 Tax=Nonomuraea sp. NBC_01738 TaxID=2976003 RepID=UPI002E0F3335|nr:helitron helicase-like domain-containing protein [Nonomuraea sp. NBC_01738]